MTTLHIFTSFNLLLLFILLLLRFCIIQPTTEAEKQRILYDDAHDDAQAALKVYTYSTIIDPVGITIGEYLGTRGLFVSSFETHAISFISLEHDGHTRQQMEAVTVSGGSYNIDSDGSFETASFAEPSRLTFDDKCNVLFVAGKKNRVIRMLNFSDETVKTIQSGESGVLVFDRNDQYQLSAPGFDVYSIASESLFVTDSSVLYRVGVNSDSSFCDHIATAATLVPYHSLSYYMYIHDYPSSARINSVVADEDTSFLYVAIAEGKNVILRVPVASVYSDQYSDIIKLVGREDSTWGGFGSGQIPPVANNGNAYQDSTTLAFPMHLQLDRSGAGGGVLLWTECYPNVGEYMLGSLAVRRIYIATGWVDFYAGKDFSQDSDTYLEVGTVGGYINDIASEASFRYPVSMAYYSDDSGAGGGAGGGLFIADKSNNAIRRVAEVINTAAPTGQFSDFLPSVAPSRTPSQQPTVSAVPTLTFHPTQPPSSEPSLSITPTSFPTRRPTKHPTMRPSTAQPTATNVWVQDNSLFNTMGLGTVHVSLGMYMMSVLVGVVVSGFIVLAYIQRRDNPPLRTIADLQQFENSHEFSCGEEDDDSDDSSNSHSNSSNNAQPCGVSQTAGLRGLLHFMRVGFGTSTESSSVRSREGSQTDTANGNETNSATASATDTDRVPTVQDILQSVRASSLENHQRHPHPTSNHLYHPSMSPQEYRELTPREQEEGVGMDDSARSTTPMILRTFGSTSDGL